MAEMEGRAAQGVGATPMRCVLITGLLLAGCSTVPMERNQLQHDQLQSSTPAPALRCAYRLASVSDRRHDGPTAGGLGANAFSLEDVERLVRQRLGAHLDSGPSASRAVSIEVRQLYLAQNLTTKIPVAVYRVSIDDGADWIVRSRSSSMNWNGTKDEGVRALTRALDDADAQLIQSLNQQCG